MHKRRVRDRVRHIGMPTDDQLAPHVQVVSVGYVGHRAISASSVRPSLSDTLICLGIDMFVGGLILRPSWSSPCNIRGIRSFCRIAYFRCVFLPPPLACCMRGAPLSSPLSSRSTLDRGISGGGERKKPEKAVKAARAAEIAIMAHFIPD